MIFLFRSFIDFIKRDERWLLHTVLFLVLCYVVLSVLVVMMSTTSLDTGITLELQEDHSPGLDRLMNIISWFASIPGALFTMGLAALGFLWLKKKTEAVFILAPVLVVPIVSVIKRIVDRARPTADLVRVVRDFNHESFPSGHVVFYTVLFGTLTYLMYRHKDIPNVVRGLVSLLSITLILSVPFSRMYLGAHWFTDVMAGFFLGCILLIGLILWYDRIKAKRGISWY
ncbi:phosphatase PAP2 family protein [Neolewinella agarilytica]|uniref:phosphatase PAP2 family protein n=1 Tax=Neolewinella agarilytica TaxID=478744 RepID=UPI0023526536|nr:phosphatase PAP2 family protein [Neolewinella agarilytica]